MKITFFYNCQCYYGMLKFDLNKKLFCDNFIIYNEKENTDKIIIGIIKIQRLQVWFIKGEN